MDYEVLRDSHPEVRRMLEAKVEWEKAIINRKDCEKRCELALADLEKSGEQLPDAGKKLSRLLDHASYHEIASTEPAVLFRQVAKFQGRVQGLQKIISIQKQVEAAEERKYQSACKALFDEKAPGYHTPELIIAFANTGQVCEGHTVEVLDIEMSEIFEVEVRPRSEVPLVQALYKRKVGESIQILVQGHCTRYKITGVRVSRNDK